MDKTDQLMELQVFQDQGPGPYKLLLEYLRNKHYAIFKSLITRCLHKNPPTIDVDHVYPYPEDKTLLDIACINGLEDFVELLLKLGANPNKENVIHHRSPLHFATEAGRAGVLRILLSHPGIEPNLVVARQTALHLAVLKDKIECAEILLENNANPNVANSKGLTPTHLAAKNGQESMVRLIFSKAKYPADIDNFRDFKKQTTRQVLLQKFPSLPLPEVVDRQIDVSDLKYFLDCNDENSYLKFADDVDITPEDNANLMKLASEHNLAKVVKSLVNHENGGDASVLAEATEIAVVRGHYKVLEQLFDAGAECTGKLLIKACQELGTRVVCGSDRMACVRLILSKPVNVRYVDENGNTALHYAARAEASEIVSRLLRAGSYIGHPNALGIPPIADIAPETMSKYLDDCLQSSKEQTKDYEDYEIEFNYQCLVPHGLLRHRDKEHLLEKGSVDYTRVCMEIEPFIYIAQSRSHRHLLKHPILSSFLYLKWQRISPILYANFIFYVIFYLLLNAYILRMTYNASDAESSENKNISNDGIANETSATIAGWQGNGTLWIFTAVMLVILFFRETLQLLSSPWDYFLNVENLVEGLLVCLGVALLAGAGPRVGAVAILLSAWELVILMGQHPRMSTAIEMFKTVTRNFLRFLFLYAFLIIAFALAFYTLFKNEGDSNFPDPGHSLFKTIIMLTGEFDADEIPFVSQPVLSHVIFVLFVFLIAIVLFNLLNGLAVSDTAEILGKAELVGLISRTKLIAYAERIVVGLPVFQNPRSCFYGMFNRTVAINPLRFLSKKILFFPDFLPESKIRVKPLRCNAVILQGKMEAKQNCIRLTMDRQIMTRTKEILSEKGRVSDYEKIIGLLSKKFDQFEHILKEMSVPSQNESHFVNNEEAEM